MVFELLRKKDDVNNKDYRFRSISEIAAGYSLFCGLIILFLLQLDQQFNRFIYRINALKSENYSQNK